jgi:hypothetical protein
VRIIDRGETEPSNAADGVFDCGILAAGFMLEWHWRCGDLHGRSDLRGL